MTHIRAPTKVPGKIPGTPAPTARAPFRTRIDAIQLQFINGVTSSHCPNHVALLFLAKMGECVQCCVDVLSTSPEPSTDPCLGERRWWYFLLSSIFTFLAGLFIVLLWRAFAFLCCRKEPEFSPNDPKQKEQKAARGKQEFEGTFMTEAKDWAGELISGQTTTGRILVSSLLSQSYPGLNQLL